MIPEADRVRGARLAYVLVFAMGFATLTGGVLGILGPVLIDELEFSRAQLGWLITFNTLSGAVISYRLGEFTDRIGAFGALGLLGVTSATALVLYAVAPSFALMAVGAVIGGVSQSFSNPVTNKLIALHVPFGERGVVTGVKQSGVFVMVTIAGVAVPGGALVIGWRPTLALFAGAAIAFTVTSRTLLPDDRRVVLSGDRRAVGTRVDPAVWWLTLYGFLHGSVGGFSFLFPLYATEELGRSEQFAGAVVSVSAIGALVGRIVWARAAERRLGYSSPLLMMAVGGIASVGIILAAGPGPAGLAFLGGFVFGASTNSWNAVGMLAVTNLSGSAGAGRGTGIVLTGFLAGLGVGPPVLGWVLDRTGSYSLAWTITAVVFAASVPLVVAWRRSERRDVLDAA
jgi:predicted MFS family arabinose efflux permease